MRRVSTTLVAISMLLVLVALAPTTMSSFSGSTGNPTSNFSAAASFCSAYTRPG
jgi:hypothetical protein